MKVLFQKKKISSPQVCARKYVITSDKKAKAFWPLLSPSRVSKKGYHVVSKETLMKNLTQLNINNNNTDNNKKKVMD